MLPSFQKTRKRHVFVSLFAMEAESELGYAGQDRTFRAAQRSLVPRPQLLDEIDEGLDREGIVVLITK